MDKIIAIDKVNKIETPVACVSEFTVTYLSGRKDLYKYVHTGGREYWSISAHKDIPIKSSIVPAQVRDYV